MYKTDSSPQNPAVLALITLL